MKAIVRKADRSDLDDLAVMFDQYRQFYEQPADAERARSYLVARMTQGESVLLIARDESGMALGFCQLYPSYCSVATAAIWVLYDLFVTENARRHGVAGALMELAEDLARKSGAARLDLSTARSNAKAQALYESRGWVRDEVFLVYSLSF